jgi:hypothetical protein
VVAHNGEASRSLAFGKREIRRENRLEIVKIVAEFEPPPYFFPGPIRRFSPDFWSTLAFILQLWPAPLPNRTS